MVAEFYRDFGEGLTKPADYATEDWNHISPYGGRDQGREPAMKNVRDVHQSFLKGTTERVEQMDVGKWGRRHLNRNKCDEPLHRSRRGQAWNRTAHSDLRVVKRDERWRIMQDQHRGIQRILNVRVPMDKAMGSAPVETRSTAAPLK